MWTCPTCKREFKNTNQRHSCVYYPLDRHFQNKPQARALFDYLVARIQQQIGPVKVESLPCCIHLVSSYTFAAVWGLKDRIRLDFRLSEKLNDERIIQTTQMSPHRYLYLIELRDKGELDGQVLSWLSQAYAQDGVKTTSS